MSLAALPLRCGELAPGQSHRICKLLMMAVPAVLNVLIPSLLNVFNVCS